MITDNVVIDTMPFDNWIDRPTWRWYSEYVCVPICRVPNI